MSTIYPEFISPDRQHWVISLNTESSACYICSSTKLRNAIKQVFDKDSITDASILHFKEAADMIIKAVKKNTGQELEVITFTDGNGKYLTISKTSCEHNFEPTHEVVPDPETVTRRAESKERRSAFPTNNEKRNQETIRKKQAEIRSRLQKLADKYGD